MKRFKYFLVVFSVLALLLSFSAVDVEARREPPPNPPVPLGIAWFCYPCCQALYLNCRVECVFDLDFDFCLNICIDDAGACVSSCLALENPECDIEGTG